MQTSSGPGLTRTHAPWLIGWLLSLPPLLAILYLLTTPLYWAAPLLAIGLVAMIGLFLRPSLAFYGVILIIPFGAYRAIGGSVKLDWILAGAALLIVVLQSLARRQLPQGLRNPLWTWWLSLLLLFVLSLYATQWPETVMHNIRNLLVAGLFMALAMTFIDRKAFLAYLPDLLIASITLGSASALLGFMFQIELFADGGGFTRGTGLTADPNNLALFVIFVTPLLVDRIAHTRQALRAYYLLAMVINIGALVSTYSRGGLLAFVLCLLMLGWNYRSYFQPRHLGMTLMLLLLSGVVFVASVPEGYWERQISLTQGKDFAMKRRSSYLEIGVQAFSASPILGHGAGTFRDIYGESSIGAAFEKEGKTRRRFAHNSYLELLVGTGLVGALVYVGMLLFAWFSFRRAIRYWRESGYTRLAELGAAYQTSLSITMIYLLIFSEPLHKYLLLLLALSQVAVLFARQDRNSHSPP